MSTSFNRLERWRLVLGEASAETLGPLRDEQVALNDALSWLYGREKDVSRDEQERRGAQASALLAIPDWLNEVHALFPVEAIERLERDAVERYGIVDVVTNRKALELLEPNETLLKAVLRTRHLMKPRVLEAARTIVKKVAEQLLARMQPEVRSAFSGVADRRRKSLVRTARNFDFKRTLARNLRHYDPVRGHINLQEPMFFSRVRNHASPWQVILLVDQSASMASSVIHSAVTAACLWSIPGIRPHLIAFDERFVDLSDKVADPVEVLMRVQLGGGTDIRRAVAYAAQLIDAPQRAIVVIISDFYEGGSEQGLLDEVRALLSQGSRVLGLAALDREYSPRFNRVLAQDLANIGVSVGVMTPGELAGFVAEAVSGGPRT